VKGEGPLLTLQALAVLACSPSSPKATPPNWQQVPVSIELRLAEGSPGPQLMPAAVYGQGRTVYLHPETLLSNRQIARVEATKTRVNRGVVLSVWLTKAGAERMADVTAHHIGDSLAILINAVVVSVPIIQQALKLDVTRPADIGVPLEPDEAAKLAAAVSKTWPARR
jgi:preprotein translocase subunit SecD